MQPCNTYWFSYEKYTCEMYAIDLFATYIHMIYACVTFEISMLSDY